MIFNAKTFAALSFIASAGLLSASAAPVAAGGDVSMNAQAAAAKRDFWDDVGKGWDEFKKGFHDGFDSEQARPLAPEEAGQKRDVKSDFADVAHALRKMGVNAAKNKPSVQADVKASKRDFWHDVGEGWDDFKEGFKDGFDAEQARPLAPEEVGHKRSVEPYVIVKGTDGKPIRAIRLPYSVNAKLQARSPADDGESALDDIGSGIGKGFGSIKDSFLHGFKEVKEDAERIIHPEQQDAIKQKRDSWEDDAGNVVGALAGWGQDHLGRISFKRDDAAASDLEARDSWEDDLGNIAGAGAGWITDHVGRIDPSDLIPSKGAKKLLDN